jgi:Bacterial inner membrane protein
LITFRSGREAQREPTSAKPVSQLVVTSLGWTATALFVASYFFARPIALRTTQMAGAFLWIIYGGLIGAVPVMVANALVIAAAAWTTVRASARRTNTRDG